MTEPFMRPASGARRAEGIPPCRERYALDQRTPPGMTPRGACCIHCGRVTARRDTEGMPACAGSLPTVQIGAPE